MRYSSCVTVWRASRISRSPSSTAQRRITTIHLLSRSPLRSRLTLIPIRMRAMQECLSDRAEQTVSVILISDSRAQQGSGSCGSSSCFRISESLSPQTRGLDIKKRMPILASFFYFCTRMGFPNVPILFCHKFSCFDLFDLA